MDGEIGMTSGLEKSEAATELWGGQPACEPNGRLPRRPGPPAAVGHDSIELALAGFDAAMRLGIAAVMSVLMPRLSAGWRRGDQK
jgi:hypothetical protein